MESTTESMTEPTVTPEGSTTVPITTAGTPSVLVGTFPTQCDAYRIPLSDEDAVLLSVLFGDRLNGTSSYADWLLSYGSTLISQIDAVIADSEVDPALDFTTAFDSIDIPGILGLASAAPMYTCYLSSMWSVALANPSAVVKRDVQRGYYAKRALPTEEEKTKLLVLFERRETNGFEFSYAEYLADETQELLNEVREVVEGQAANPSAYTSLFSVLDVRQLLSVVSNAPIYTQGLSAAFETALTSFSATRTMSTSTTNVVPTNNLPSFTTSTVDVSEVLRSTLETVTQHVTSTQIVGTATEVYTSVANAPEGYDSTRRITVGGAATRTVTICVDVCASLSSEAAAAATTTVRVYEYTGEDGRVTRSTVTETICDDYCSSLREEASRRAVTTTIVYEVQTRNAAIRKAAALGLGIFGYFAFFL